MQYLPFRIAGLDFVVDASRVRAIVPFEGPREDLPVFDLRKRLGLPPIFYGRRPLLVVVETKVIESGLAGFAVDYVSDVMSSSPRDRYSGGKLRARGRPRWLLDPDSLRIPGISSLSRRKPDPVPVSLPE